jgi:hypothetical protein
MRPGLRIEATVGAALVHVPPVVVHESKVEAPTQIPSGVPVIAAGPALTVIVFVTKHPLGLAYVISVVPADTPYTSPVPDTVPTAGVELLHAPPAVVLLSVMVSPAHTADGPVIADGNPFTVATAVVIQPAPEV